MKQCHSIWECNTKPWEQQSRKAMTWTTPFSQHHPLWPYAKTSQHLGGTSKWDRNNFFPTLCIRSVLINTGNLRKRRQVGLGGFPGDTLGTLTAAPNPCRSPNSYLWAPMLAFGMLEFPLSVHVGWTRCAQPNHLHLSPGTGDAVLWLWSCWSL